MSIPNKDKCRSKTQHAILSGALIKQPCEVCGEEKVHAHHLSYDNHLNVKWLCPKHHGEWHAENETPEGYSDTRIIHVSEETYRRLTAHKLDEFHVQGEVVSFDTVISEMMDFVEENGDREAITRIKKSLAKAAQ